MRSDYANSKPRKSTPRGKRPAPAKKPTPPAAPRQVSPLRLLIGCVVVAAFAYLLWFLKNDDKAPEPAAVQAQPVNAKSVVVKPKPKDALPPKPKQEWTYQQELENKKVEVDVPERAKQTARPYQMQCGSFRKDSQAQELKAVIAFQGLEAQVRKVAGSSGDWYKVVLGPYDHKRQAERERHTLQRAGVNGCMIWYWTN